MGLLSRRLGPPASPPRPTLRAGARAWAAALAAVCGLGLVAGIPSGFVPDLIEPPVGGLLLLVAAREGYRARVR